MDLSNYCMDLSNYCMDLSNYCMNLSNYCMDLSNYCMDFLLKVVIVVFIGVIYTEVAFTFGVAFGLVAIVA